ncbi:MAG: radical SAM family heme chaperone HemW, partial [Ruminococcus sp.]
MSDCLGLYIHIPFCHSKCPYCDFFSIRGNSANYGEYVEVLNKNIVMWSKKINKKVDTIYFGGGTPSIIGADLLTEILISIKENFNVSDDAEITLEVNPHSGKFFDFNKAYHYGFNRISIGLQSSNKAELKSLGRTHTTDDVINTINLIREAKIENISLDVMMGIPNQTKDSLKETLDFCIKSKVNHISSYILKLEENTVFYKRQEKLNLPSDDETADLYKFAVGYLAEHKYNQYEISNFSKSGFESKHNLKYWNLEDYLGIGPAAHSFINKKRFYYKNSIEDFKNNNIISDGTGGNQEEYIMLQLRLKKGL